MLTAQPVTHTSGIDSSSSPYFRASPRRRRRRREACSTPRNSFRNFHLKVYELGLHYWMVRCHTESFATAPLAPAIVHMLLWNGHVVPVILYVGYEYIRQTAVKLSTDLRVTPGGCELTAEKDQGIVEVRFAGLKDGDGD